MDVIVPYVQRRMNADNADGAGHSANHHSEILHGLLFHPIAGDSAPLSVDNETPSQPPLLCMRQLQFGMLDAGQTLFFSGNVGLWLGRLRICRWPTSPTRRLAQTRTLPVHAFGVNRQPRGCLADLRMGATTNGKACQTCKQHHHNCAGHFGSIQLPYPVFNPLFVGLLVAVLQIVCINCQRLRISPYYIQAMFPRRGRQAHRLKGISAMCARQSRCQFCAAIRNVHGVSFLPWPLLHFKQQGISILARRVQNPGPHTILVPAASIFATLVRLSTRDLNALGFEWGRCCIDNALPTSTSHNHPCNAVMGTLLVLPPVSRPAMRTVNTGPHSMGTCRHLKTGNPFVVEVCTFLCPFKEARGRDTISTEYHSILKPYPYCKPPPTGSRYGQSTRTSRSGQIRSGLCPRFT